MFCYYNNGLSFRSVDADYAPQPTEALFPDYATPEQLANAFINYQSALDKETLIQNAQIALATSDLSSIRVNEAILAGATTATAADVIDFINWRRIVRSIRSQASGAPITIPTRPPNPAGT